MPKKRSEQDCDNEVFIARRIAGCEPGEDASFNFAQAILNCKWHQLFCDGERLYAVYMNEFGPTCTVDDVIERMTMKDWRVMCDHLVRNLLSRAGLTPKNPCKIPQPHVIVKMTPETTSDVIHRLEFTIRLPRKWYCLAVEAINKVRNW